MHSIPHSCLESVQTDFEAQYFGMWAEEDEGSAEDESEDDEGEEDESDGDTTS